MNQATIKQMRQTAARKDDEWRLRRQAQIVRPRRVVKPKQVRPKRAFPQPRAGKPRWAQPGGHIVQRPAKLKPAKTVPQPAKRLTVTEKLQAIYDEIYRPAPLVQPRAAVETPGVVKRETPRLPSPPPPPLSKSEALKQEMRHLAQMFRNGQLGGEPAESQPPQPVVVEKKPPRPAEVPWVLRREALRSVAERPKLVVKKPPRPSPPPPSPRPATKSEALKREMRGLTQTLRNA